jgi:hypothetical protein
LWHKELRVNNALYAFYEINEFYAINAIYAFYEFNALCAIYAINEFYALRFRGVVVEVGQCKMKSRKGRGSRVEGEERAPSRLKRLRAARKLFTGLKPRC